MRSLAAGVRAAARLEQEAGRSTHRHADEAPVPFITISRQAGAGGRSLADGIVERLNALEPHGPPWTAWDGELVRKVADEYGLPEESVAALEDRTPSWFSEALNSLAFADDPRHADEFRVFRRVSRAVRALAEMGRVILVGRGGVFLTRDLAGGVHLRLVAPLEYRVGQYARRFSLARDEAARRVREIDHSRHAFYRRHWPGRPLSPESFTLTINTEAVPVDRAVECVLPLLQRRARPAAGGPLRLREV